MSATLFNTFLSQQRQKETAEAERNVMMTLSAVCVDIGNRCELSSSNLSLARESARVNYDNAGGCVVDAERKVGNLLFSGNLDLAMIYLLALSERGTSAGYFSRVYICYKVLDPLSRLFVCMQQLFHVLRINQLS